MVDQTHRIKRQVLEIEVKGMEEARQMQERLSRLHRRRLVDIIAGICDELSAPDRVHRIDVLELDLGTIDTGDFDDEFATRLSQALRRALGDAIRAIEDRARRGEERPGAASGLELLAIFARTGCLPWWAGAADRDLLRRCVTELLATSPHPLARLVRELAAEPPFARRLVAHLPDPVLGQVVALLARVRPEQGDIAALAGALLPVLRATGAADALPGRQLRDRLWQLVLHTAAHQDAAIAPQALMETVLVQLAPNAVPRLRALRMDRSRDLPAPESESASVPGSESASESASESESAPASASDDAAQAQAILASLETLRAGAGPLAELASVLHAVAARSPAGAPRSGQRWIEQAMDMGMLQADFLRQCIVAVQTAGAGDLPRPARSDIAALLLHALDRARAAAARTHDAAAREDIATPASRTAARKPGAPPHRATAGAADDLVEVHIANSGLAILWPFLTSFFTRLGLVRDKRFTSDDAMQRAVGLLQYLALPFERDAWPPEYELAINKVLCGVDLAALFDFGPPVSDDEVAECDTLLAAAIAHAPILRNMSGDGFRGTFILRPGILSARDGAWLLRVERQSYDLVLDRFPWSWTWVKLPWMPAPLRVEW